MRASAVVCVDVEMTLGAGCVVVTLHGELDVSIAASVAPAFTAPAASGAVIIVDLADVAFMDSCSLRELTSARARARRAGGDLLLAGPQPIVLRFLSLTGIFGPWPVSASVDEAAGYAASAVTGVVSLNIAQGRGLSARTRNVARRARRNRGIQN